MTLWLYDVAVAVVVKVEFMQCELSMWNVYESVDELSIKNTQGR